MMLLSAEMPVNAMAGLLDEHDTRLWRVLMHYVEQAHAKSDWSAIRRIAVDETSSRRGHRYVTNVLDAENSSLLLMVQRLQSTTSLDDGPSPYRQGALDHLKIILAVDEFLSAARDPRVAWIVVALILRLTSVRHLSVAVR